MNICDRSSSPDFLKYSFFKLDEHIQSFPSHGLHPALNVKVYLTIPNFTLELV